MAAVAAKYEWLPVTFRNVVVEYREIGNGFEATIRSSAATKEELTQWLQYFEDKTNTRWGVRRTHPDVQRLAFRTDFVCQHSNFNKGDARKRASKNCDCGAKLTQKIKIVSRKTKQKDPHIKVYIVP